MLSIGLLLLRVVVGLTLAAHGAQKLFKWFDGPGIDGFAAGLEKMRVWPARPQAWLSGLVEFFGGIAVALGFLSPIPNIAAIGNMVVAIVLVHWAKGFFNAKGGYEFALLVATSMLALAITGPGTYSLDHLLGIRLPEPATWIVMVILAVLGIVGALFGGRLLATQRRPQTAH
jgi:putative oxidoreductase